jgi:hypothetical protein
MPLMMRRRPVLRAAAVGTGAYVAGKRRQESYERESAQEQRIAELEASRQAPPPPAYGQPPQAAAPAPQAGGLAPGVIDQLKELGQLREQGVLSDEEFAAQKAKLLG